MAVTKGTTTTADSSPTVTKNTGLANTDIECLMFNCFGSLVTALNKPVPPSGFTEAFYQLATSAAFGASVQCFYKVITNAAGEPANYSVGAPTLGYGSGAYQGCTLYRIIGADNANPISDSGTNAASSTTPSTGAAVDTTTASSIMLLNLTCEGGFPSTPSGTTKDFNGDGGDACCYSQTFSSIQTGLTVSTTVTNGPWAIGWVTFKDASGGVALTPRRLPLLGVG